MCVAAPVGFREDLSAPLRVATKYPGIAKRYYAGKSREIEIIKLNGSIELAPILGLSDVIVDIVETGATLEQNHLEVIETILPISARLIVNKAAMRFQAAELQPLLQALQARQTEGDKACLPACAQARRYARIRRAGEARSPARSQYPV